LKYFTFAPIAVGILGVTEFVIFHISLTNLLFELHLLLLFLLLLLLLLGFLCDSTAAAAAATSAEIAATAELSFPGVVGTPAVSTATCEATFADTPAAATAADR